MNIQTSEKWTFVSSYLRHHGLAFWGMALRALSNHPLEYARLADLGAWNDSSSRSDHDQIALAQRGRSSLFPGCLEKAIYLIPKGWKNDDWVSTYKDKVRKNWSVLETSLRREYEHLDTCEQMISEYREIAHAKEIYLTAKSKWKTQDELSKLWQIVHELPLRDQVDWFCETNAFGMGKVAIGPWEQIKASDSRVLLVEVGTESLNPDDIESWTIAIDDWVKLLPESMRHLGINLSGTSHADLFAWRHLQSRRLTLAGTKFIGVRTLSQNANSARFRPFRFYAEKQQLFKSNDGASKDTAWYSPERKDAQKRLQSYREWNDLFSIALFGPRGSGKSSMVKNIFSDQCVERSCATIPEALADSILFGHKKGAFTGASADEIGLFGELEIKYQKWTKTQDPKSRPVLFLDEFHHLPHAVQVKLLVALQQKSDGLFEYHPLGGWGGKHKKLELEGRLKFQLILGTNRTEEELRHDRSIAQDLLDRVLQRKVDVPGLDLKELAEAWNAIWSDLKFTPSVENPANPASGPGSLFVDWLRGLHENGQLPGHFRDLQRIAIMAADSIRMEGMACMDEATFKKLGKEWKGYAAGVASRPLKIIQKSQDSPESVVQWIHDNLDSRDYKNAESLSNHCKSLIASAIETKYGGLNKLEPHFKPSETTLRRWKDKRG